MSSPIHDESGDDLEKTLMIAAQDANARQIETEEALEKEKADETNEVEQKEETHSRKRKRSANDDIVNEPQPAKYHLSADNQKKGKTSEGYANVVANHYNLLEEKGLDERSKSRIVYMRNFHNWIKSMLINEFLTKIKNKKRYDEAIRVADMCCGKGGDLLKWRKGNISHLICSDIAAVSLEQCESRYKDMKSRYSQDWNGASNLFSIEYIVADCSRVRLREQYKDPSIKLDLVSCQFAFHYSFESLSQAECMIRNAAECLQPGGYFIGTIPDANDLIARARKFNSKSFGNEVYKVTFNCDIEKPPLFGAKYNFHLDGVVDCPEFLVHFPTFVKLAKKYGLKFVKKEKFYNFYERMKDDGKQLLTIMRSLETYPPYDTGTVLGTAENDYDHAKEFLKREHSKDQSRQNLRIGTLSKSEWEASSIYMLFAFQKVKNTWNSDGTPSYDFN